MDNLKIVYRILAILEKNLDYDELDAERMCADALGISENRFNAIMLMLYESGYISGISCKKYIDESNVRIMSVSRVKITLKGLEYLNENSTMRKLADTAKGIADVIGGMI